MLAYDARKQTESALKACVPSSLISAIQRAAEDGRYTLDIPPESWADHLSPVRIVIGLRLLGFKVDMAPRAGVAVTVDWSV